MKKTICDACDAYFSVSGRLQSAISSSREHEGKYEASHPNLRKLDTGGKSTRKDDSNTNQYEKVVSFPRLLGSRIWNCIKR